MIGAVAVLAVAAAAGLAMRRSAEPPVVGLFTTLPIYWNEASGVSDLLADDQAKPWPREVLEQRYHVQPIDLLEPAAAGKADPLGAYRYLMLAQPRALSAGENVALDGWVRAGGKLLLFADPMLTAQSIHAIGDARRPQDVALLSPILAHWGLRLEFDEAQPGGEQEIELLGARIPVQLAGRLDPIPGAGKACAILAGGIAASCTIGKGRVLVMADGALLDTAEEARSAREDGLATLLDKAFTD